MAEVEARQAPLPPRIGRHQVVGYIATGGMAELFLGKEPSGRPVVIKRILPHLARQTTFVSMFIDEARIGSMTKHPNLVECYELGQVGTDLFLVMEYLVGENLAGLTRRLIKRKERMSFGLAAYIMAEVCDGLHAAHELTDDQGNRLELVHRDVSPQNIFITYGGDVKLLDFGVATAAYRLTQTATGEVKGKYAYMSPEQCHGDELDRRSDIFSLGTVLYELTTLRRLFKRPNELQVMKAVTEDPIPRPTREVEDYPPVLEDVCVKALARDPRQRFANAAEMRDALIAAMHQLGLGVDPHEALASKLARLFGDRVAQKRELLDRVRTGGDLEDLLKAEVDEAVEVPLVSHVTATPLSAVRAPVPPSETAMIKSRRARTTMLAALAVAVVAGAAIGVWLRMRGQSATDVPDDAAAHVEVTGVEAIEPPPAAPAPTGDVVTIVVETNPSAIKISVAGEDRGQTPVTVKLPRGTQPVKVELRQPGYQPEVSDLVPDRDQRLYFSLTRLEHHGTPTTSKKPPTTKQGFHKFE
jgi:serine/threonine-protein kinase